jgi:small membrane protein
MKIVLIQLVLIGVVIGFAVRLLRGRGARTQAVRRVGLLLFAALAVWSILFPSVWDQIARMVGVGRGTDMVLYALVVAFLSFTVTTYLRFRDLETRYTKLARRLALDEAGLPSPLRSQPPGTVPQELETVPQKQEPPYAGS